MADTGKGPSRDIDQAAMERLLEDCGASAAGVILRLTWQAGLTVEELCALRWRDVSLTEKALWAGQRRVALEEESVHCLQTRLEARRAGDEPFVLLTDRRRRPMQPDAVYRLARRTLDREERLRGVTLKMLREDHRRRMRQERDGADEYALWKVLQTEGASTAGIALWLLWRMGLRLREIADLTWNDVDLKRNVLRLPGRCVPMGTTLPRLLRQIRREGDNPHVLLTPESRRPYEPARLSRCVEAALRRGGVEDLRPGELSRLHARQKTEEKLLRCLERRGSLSRQEAAGQLGLSPAAAYRRLAALTQGGMLERIGGKYYPAGAAVPAEKLENAVCSYLRQEKSAGCRQLAELLGIDSRQCGRILRRMEQEGRLIRRNRRYQICQERTP